MTTDRDIADKRNEVTMLRLQIAEHKARRRLNEIEQLELTDVSALREANETIHNAQIYIDTLKAELSNSKSAIVMKNGVINDRVEHLERVYNQLHGFQDDVYEKNKTIDELNETINECARGEAEDSRVLMQVVEAVRQYDGSYEHGTMNQFEMIATIVEDYLDAPETPVVTLKTPSIGTRVVSKNEETHAIDENKMEAVRMLIGSDMWVLHTDDEAVEDKQQKETIDELKDFIREQGDHIADQDKIIKGVRSRMAGARIIIDSQATSIDVINDKIRMIGGVLSEQKRDRLNMYTSIDEITKIIQEE